MTSKKLQKVLADYGLGSRRILEQWIREGRVQVNGNTAHIGQRVEEGDKVSIDNKKVIRNACTKKKSILVCKEAFSSLPSTPRLLMYHKALGEVCTRSDPQGRPTVFKSLPPLSKGRWVMVGRLDINTSGLLLFSNVGEYAHQLMHPSFGYERHYKVRVLGAVDAAMLQRLRYGVHLSDGPAHFKKIIPERNKSASAHNQWYSVVLTSGRNRLVRRLWESQGVSVNRLVRVGYGKLRLPKDLPPGHYLELQSPCLDDGGFI